MRVGLCKRHGLEDICEDFVFDADVADPLDFKGHRQHVERFLVGWDSHSEERLRLYVTGLAPLLAAFLHVWSANGYAQARSHGCGLVLMHWNRETESYEEDDWSMGDRPSAYKATTQQE